MSTLDPAIRDLLVVVRLALRQPWSGDERLPDRLATIDTTIEWTVLFGDPAREARSGGLERAVEWADAARVRRADRLALVPGVTP